MAAKMDVFTILDSGDDKPGFWHKIGVAWKNRDGSLNVKLNSLPLNGTLHIREAREATQSPPEPNQKKTDSKPPPSYLHDFASDI